MLDRKMSSDDPKADMPPKTIDVLPVAVPDGDLIDIIEADLKDEIKGEESEIKTWLNRLQKLQVSDIPDDEKKNTDSPIFKKILELLQSIIEAVEPAGYYLKQVLDTAKEHFKNLDNDLSALIQKARSIDSESEHRKLLAAICKKCIEILNELEYINEKALAEKDYCLACRHAIEKALQIAQLPISPILDVQDIDRLLRDELYNEIEQPVIEIREFIAEQRGKIDRTKLFVDSFLNQYLNLNQCLNKKYAENSSLLFNAKNVIKDELSNQQNVENRSAEQAQSSSLIPPRCHII